jgi:hypothetical protein
MASPLPSVAATAAELAALTEITRKFAAARALPPTSKMTERRVPGQVQDLLIDRRFAALFYQVRYVNDYYITRAAAATSSSLRHPLRVALRSCLTCQDLLHLVFQSGGTLRIMPNTRAALSKNLQHFCVARLRKAGMPAFAGSLVSWFLSYGHAKNIFGMHPADLARNFACLAVCGIYAAAAGAASAVEARSAQIHGAGAAYASNTCAHA